MANILNFVQITFDRSISEIQGYLQQTYSKAGLLFTNASPYGQILNVISNLQQLSFLYLKNAIKQFDLSNPNALNETIIRNAAILAGHNPSRSISATGTLKFTVKSSTDLTTSLPGGSITFSNKMGIKNNTNGLQYSLNLGGNDSVTHKITQNYQFFIPIIQGQWVNTTFTGDGTILQSYSINLSGKQDVENFNYQVLVNGVYWTAYTQLWDMIAGENACVVRTGFNGGIDIIFGNGDFGAIPNVGDKISVYYIQTSGSIGNIFRRTSNDWKFLDLAVSGSGTSIDPTTIFDISIYTDINFGADKENLLFTKNILPIVSPNFILALPQQYAYAIKRLGVFSHVNAYQNNGTIYIVSTPNITLFKSQNSNYFNVDINAFSLDAYEISKLDLYLKTSGNIQLTQNYVITSPNLSYYVMNIYLVIFTDSSIVSVTNEIIGLVSNYFLNLNRTSRIPKADLVSLILSSYDVYSVDIQFISKDNEVYHYNELTRISNAQSQYNSKLNTNISVPQNPNYDPTAKVGLDPVLGDILFNASDIPIIRGGWSDRNGIYYSDNIDDSGLKSINIISRGTVDASNRNKNTTTTISSN